MLTQNIAPAERVSLDLNPETAYYIIDKAREFDVKVAPSETSSPFEPSDDLGSNAIDSDQREILEDYPDDPTHMELTSAIDGLNEDEKIDLIALAWTGRGDYSRSEWEEAHTLATERHHHTARYLTGMPTLGDFLEEGLSTLGYTREESAESASNHESIKSPGQAK